MKIPAAYAWLADVGLLPRTIQEGLKLLGVTKVVGRFRISTGRH